MMSSFCVLGWLSSFVLRRLSFALIVSCGCVVELIGTSPFTIQYLPLHRPSLCNRGEVLPSEHVLESSSRAVVSSSWIVMFLELVFPSRLSVGVRRDWSTVS